MKNNTFRTALVSALILCGTGYFTGNASAQQADSPEAPVMTLEEAVNLALKNNAAEQKAAAEVIKAKAVKEEALTYYFPKISIVGGAFQASSPVIEYGIGDIPNEALKETVKGLWMQYGAALGLPTGISMFKQGSAAAAVAVQPVYAGGKIVNSNRLAKVGVEAAQLQQKITERDLALDVREAYYLIISLEEKLETLNSVRHLLDTVSVMAETAVKAGVALRNDLLSVELRQNEIASQSIRLTNGIALSRRALAQMIGISADSLGVLQKPQEAMDLTLPKFREGGVRPEAGLLSLKVESARLQRKLALADALPQVALGASYMYIGYSSMPYRSSAIHIDGTTDWNSRYYGFLGVTLKIPITDWWKTSVRMRQSSADMSIAMTDRKDLNEKMTLQEQQVYDSVNEAAAIIVRQKSSVASARENFRLAGVNYEAGLIGVTDVLQAQSLLLQSENDLTDARISYLVNSARYKALTE